MRTWGFQLVESGAAAGLPPWPGADLSFNDGQEHLPASLIHRLLCALTGVKFARQWMKWVPSCRSWSKCWGGEFSQKSSVVVIIKASSGTIFHSSEPVPQTLQWHFWQEILMLTWQLSDVICCGGPQDVARSFRKHPVSEPCDEWFLGQIAIFKVKNGPSSSKWKDMLYFVLGLSIFQFASMISIFSQLLKPHETFGPAPHERKSADFRLRRSGFATFFKGRLCSQWLSPLTKSVLHCSNSPLSSSSSSSSVLCWWCLPACLPACLSHSAPHACLHPHTAACLFNVS